MRNVIKDLKTEEKIVKQAKNYEMRVSEEGGKDY